MTLLALILLLALTPTAKTARPKKPHHSHRFLVAQQLVRGLKNTPLARLAWTFEAEGHRWNVNPFFVAAITGTESSYGAARCGSNPFGWNSCRGDSFTSLSHAIRYVTERLRRDYMNGWGLRSVESIGMTYCGNFCGARWAEHTRVFMQQLGDVSGGVVYPQ